MKKIKVTVIDKNKLRLEENGSIGDIIDLSEIQSIDTESISQLILQEQEKIINEKIKSAREEARNLEMTNSKIVLSKKENDINQIINDLKIQLSNKETEIKNIKVYNEQIIDNLKNTIRLEEKNKNEQLLKEYELQIKDLEYKMHTKEKEYSNNIETKIKELENNYKIELLNKKNENDNLKKEIEQKIEILKQKNELEITNITTNLINEKKQIEIELANIKRQKSEVQIKLQGEELEKWCNEQYNNIAVSGFENCLWYKDNKVIKSDYDQKSTKADYIFEIYLDDQKTQDTKLVSLCCEMKSESPNSKIKTKNSDHYKKLEDDRIKKNCNYSILISELEWDAANDSPIKKVQEYENMYVVRPTYFITFITLLKSLTEKYKSFFMQKRKEEITLKDSLALKQDFEELKNTYLDKPLLAIQKIVEDIYKEANKSKDASEKIISYSRNLIDVKIDEIKNKIERFNIDKIVRKIDKINT